MNLPKNPSPSRSSSGSEISALTPQTIVVFPIRTSADPLAVEIEPNLLIHRTSLEQSKKRGGRAIGFSKTKTPHPPSQKKILTNVYMNISKSIT